MDAFLSIFNKLCLYSEFAFDFFFLLAYLDDVLVTLADEAAIEEASEDEAAIDEFTLNMGVGILAKMLSNEPIGLMGISLSSGRGTTKPTGRQVLGGLSLTRKPPNFFISPTKTKHATHTRSLLEKSFKNKKSK